MNTGYLTFLSLGKTEELNCDYLGLEEEAASSTAISTIQESKRKVMVWTPNTEKEQRKFLTSPADYIITDYVSQAMRLSDELDNRNEFAIIEDWLAN